MAAPPRPSSPTASLRSTHSFLDEDPYPSGARRPSSISLHSSASTPTATSGDALTPSSLLNRLESLLRAKAEEVQLAGQLGQALLVQQQELEGRIRDIAEVSARYAAGTPSANGEGESSDGEKEVGEETKKSLRALEAELERWDQGNQDMYQVVGTAAQQGVPAIETVSSPSLSDVGILSPPLGADSAGGFQTSGTHRRPSISTSRRPSIADLSAALSPSTSATSINSASGGDPSSSRRARNNAQHRTNDIELATEIGQSLLVEVRRLQALLQEKEEHVQGLARERDAMKLEVEQSQVQRRTVEESVEKYKEVNWELELSTQELRTALSAAQASHQRAEVERTRQAKDLASTRDALDQQRSEAERVSAALEQLKQRHETDLATMRKSHAGLQRDKSDLASSLEGLRNELATRKRGIGRRGEGSPAPGTPGYRGGLGGDDSDDDFPGEEDGDVFGRSTNRRKTGDGFPSAIGGGADVFGEGDSPSASPVQRAGFGGPRGEAEGLRASLAHAQRQLTTLRAGLAREKAAKMELRKRLVDGGLATKGDKEWGEDPLDGEDSDDDILPSATPEDEEDEDSYIDEDSSFDRPPSRQTPAHQQQLSSAWPRSGRGSARGSARGRGSARHGGGGGVRVPSRLARAIAAGSDGEEGDSSTGAGSPATAQEEDVSQAEDSFDQQSIFAHEFGSGFSDDGSAVDSPTRVLSLKQSVSSATFVPRTNSQSFPSSSRRERAMSAETEDSFTSSPRGSMDLFRPSDENGGTLADILAASSASANHQNTSINGSRPGMHGRPASIGSLASILNSARSAKKSPDLDETLEDRELVEWKEEGTMTDFPLEVKIEIREVEVVKEVSVPVEVIKEVRVEVPVEVLKEVRVEVPVDRIVDRIVEVEKRVDVPVPFEVIREVEVVREVEVPRDVERIVEKVVERVVEVPKDVERIVEKIVEVPVEKIVYVDKIVDREVEKVIEVEKVVQVEKVVEVEKVVYVDRDVPRDVHVDREVEKVVYVDRDVPRDVPRDVVVEKEVEKIVYVDRDVPREVIVEKVVEKEVEKEVEKIVYVDRDVPRDVLVDREVEKIVYVDRDVPRDVEKVVYVDKIVEVIKEVPRNVEVEKIVERIVEVEKRVEVPVPFEVEKIVEVERIVERFVEVPAPLPPAPSTADISSQTDAPAAPPVFTSAQVQTDAAPSATTTPTPQPAFSPPLLSDDHSTPVPTSSSRMHGLSMEDRALANQKSLSDLASPQLQRLSDRDATISSFSMLQGLRSAPESQTTGESEYDDVDDARSESTDRVTGSAGRAESRQTNYYSESGTETEMEYEDARESLGGASSRLGAPSLGGPRQSFSDSLQSRSTSMQDFVSVRSGRTGAFGDDETDDEEVLAGNGAFRRTLRGAPAGFDLKPVMAEMEVQTDSLPVVEAVPLPLPAPEIVYVDRAVEVQVEKIVYVDKVRDVEVIKEVLVERTIDRPVHVEVEKIVERVVEKIVYVDRPVTPTPPPLPNKDDDLDESAARASAFLGDVTPSSSPIATTAAAAAAGALFAGAATAAVLKGKSKEQPAVMMGPPPVPAGTRKASSPRKSGASTASTRSLRQPPPRPTSPPPADLLFRAQSPAFDEEYNRRSTFLAPPIPSSTSNSHVLRSQASSVSTAPSRPHQQQPFGNFQKVRSQPSQDMSGGATPRGSRQTRQQPSGSSAVSISELSMHSDFASRRLSLASEATSDGGFDASNAPTLPGQEQNAAMRDSTDPAVIHAITQTMIGEFMHKYTRRKVGKGMSEKRHKRFFWVHPYTKTLYWSSNDPGAQTTSFSNAKSAYIEGVRQVLDPNPFPPGLHQNSIIIKTREREMKFTAATKERHEMWFSAINYLLSRPEGAETPTGTPGPALRSNASRLRSRTLATNPDSPNEFYGVPSQIYNLNGAAQSEPRLNKAAYARTVPRQSNGPFGTNSSKRAGTAAEEYGRAHTSIGMYSSPQSIRSASDFDDVEVVDRNEAPALGDDDDEFEGLENVRACCGGKHDVGSLSRRHGTHRHSHHTRASTSQSDLEYDAASRSTTPDPNGNRNRSKVSLGSISRRMSAIPTPRKSLGSKSMSSQKSLPSRPLSPLPLNGNNGTIGRRA